MKLFCIPCAGGTAEAYSKWKRYLHPNIQLLPIELKNRGKRIDEKSYKDMEEAVEDVFNKIKGLITNNNYALFGHSMGAVIVYELYYKLVKSHFPAPKNIFIFGMEPPNMKKSGIRYHELDNVRFKESIIELGGIPDKLAKNEEAYTFFAPIIKEDFRILENYKTKEKENLMNCNIIVINGINDKFSSKNLDEYKNYTSKQCKIYRIKGNHFSLYENPLETVRIINSNLVL